MEKTIRKSLLFIVVLLVYMEIMGKTVVVFSAPSFWVECHKNTVSPVWYGPGRDGGGRLCGLASCRDVGERPTAQRMVQR